MGTHVSLRLMSSDYSLSKSKLSKKLVKSTVLTSTRPISSLFYLIFTLLPPCPCWNDKWPSYFQVQGRSFSVFTFLDFSAPWNTTNTQLLKTCFFSWLPILPTSALVTTPQNPYPTLCSLYPLCLLAPLKFLSAWFSFFWCFKTQFKYGLCSQVPLPPWLPPPKQRWARPPFCQPALYLVCLY